MNILWCGGEDIDFPNGAAVTSSTNTGDFRAGYARAALKPGTSIQYKSTLFQGGAVTSAWFTCRFYNFNAGATSYPVAALGKSGTNNSLGFGVAGSGNQISLFKATGPNVADATTLATESGTTFGSSALHRVDMQVTSFGTSATVKVYVDGSLVITFTGDVTLSGFTSFDSVYVNGSAALVSKSTISECIVADADTRGLQGLVTMALTGAGDTNAWTSPTYTNINLVTFSDANPTYSNTPGQDNMYNVTDLPSGTFGVRMVKQTIRAAASAGSATQIKMGYKTAGSTVFGSGSTKTPASSYATFEQYDATNPFTSGGWAQSDMNTLQVDYQSA